MATLHSTVRAIVPDDDGDPMEYAVPVPFMYVNGDEPGITIGISAAGGGTVGIVYADNRWIYRVMVNGAELISGDDLRSGGMGGTHQDMIRSLCSFLGSDGESLYMSPDSGLAESYSTEQVEFLVSEYERLQMFGMES